MGESERANFGVVLRAQPDHSFLVLRHYDRDNALQLIRFRKGRAQIVSRGPRIAVRRNQWYRIKMAAVDDLLVGKLWAVSDPEPNWQFRARIQETRPGGTGLTTQDGSVVDFRTVRIWSGPAIAPLRETLARERKEHEKRVREALKLQLEPSPFVVRTPDGPRRRVRLRAVAHDQPEPVGGKITATIGGATHAVTVQASDFRNGTYPLLVPEPKGNAQLRVAFDTSIGKRLDLQTELAPARPWTFYMTPHTHYDIGYTDPQPEVIERLSKDMERAVQYCEQTADWPPESRYRWTCEVSALVKNYIERHSEAEVARLMKWVRAGRIEICGFYLNMPTELVGHEELIRCLYYGRTLRDRYRVPIDTAIIDDVPGYTWALPELFVESGITRIALRANSIHAQFLWDRRGAVPRPFYWEGPEGSRVFVWYTDSYREGNFFRTPGLHEDSFRSIIRRNERVGTTVDDIQLRMGGDNLPPDLDASRNVRAWNEKYVWPRVVVATNREFLEPLEKRYGAGCKTFRGDIPSWWAEGPASSALETGMNRLAHDALTGAEALATLAWLTDPNAEYPRDTINRAYDNMLHFDEHTWGASGSIRSPRSTETIAQWKWKSRYAHRASKLTREVQDRALSRLSEPLASADADAVVVWNTLSWPRTDVVTLSLAEGPFKGATGLSVVDPRDGKRIPSQIDKDDRTAFFVARDVPGSGYVRYAIERAATAATPREPDNSAILENRFYRVVVAPESGDWTSWYDKTLRRELLDGKAKYRANQAVFETPLGGTDTAIRGRDVIERKRPVPFKRTAARGGKLVAVERGPVFAELTTEATLPTCPKIRQTIRLYHELKAIDLINVVEKEENFDPEGVYFAFPFAVDSPEFHVEIADAVMRPGTDQLPLTCQDFYSIQHWTDVSGDGFGILFAPLEAPLIVLSDMNVYKWADRLTFDKAHLYSLVMNNYWYTNFRGGQGGTLTFRYRLGAYAGEHDAVRATEFAWQPFCPLQAAILKRRPGGQAPASGTWLKVEGDPILVSGVKVAESGDAVVIRLLEPRGRPARCTLRFALPGDRGIVQAYVANALEERRETLAVSDNTVTVALRANEIATLAVVPAAP